MDEIITMTSDPVPGLQRTVQGKLGCCKYERLVKAKVAHGTVHWAGNGIANCLREAETKLAQAGWTPLFEAIHWIGQTYPEQTLKPYGCGSWRHVIHASQQFEIRKKSQAENGATVVWYRSLPRETSKEQE